MALYRIRAPSALGALDALKGTLERHSGAGQSLFFAASKEIDAEQLSGVVSKQAPVHVGALVDDEPFSISAAFFSEATPFLYEQLGAEAIRLGREIQASPSPEAEEDLPMNISDLFSSSASRQFSTPSNTVPELANGSHSALFYSGARSEAFLGALGNAPRHLSLLGLVPASTVFHTGLEHTLFFNTTIRGSGAVGLGLQQSLSTTLAYPRDLIPLSDTLYRVTGAQSNIIVSLDDLPAAKVLYDLLPCHSSKDTLFFASLHSQTGQTLFTTQITSGSPSRGPIAFSTALSLPTEPSYVRFWALEDKGDRPNRLSLSIKGLDSALSFETLNPLFITLPNGKLYPSDLRGLSVAAELS